MFHIQFSLVWLAQAQPASDDPSIGVLVGFLFLLGFLILVLTRGKPRTTPDVVDPQTPDRWKDSPVYAENRRKAAAAAVAAHLHSPHNPSS